MPTWVAILIGASVGLSTLVYTILAKRRDRRDADTRRTATRREKNAEWRGEVNADRVAFKAFMDEVRGKLERILGILRREFPALVEMGSRLRLTKLGRDVSKELDAKAWAEKIVPTVIDKLPGPLPYDVQRFCFDYAEKLSLSDRQAELVKLIAFENGLPATEILQVLAVELRDILLVELEKMGEDSSSPEEVSPPA